jgi:hypothetical protein
MSDVDCLIGGGAVDFSVSLEALVGREEGRSAPVKDAQRGSPATPRRVEEAAGLNSVMGLSRPVDASRHVFFRAAYRISRVAGLRPPRRSFHVS